YIWLVSIKQNRDYLVTTGESVASINLRYFEVLKAIAEFGKNRTDSAELKDLTTKAEWLEKIVKLFKFEADVIIDEVHSGLNVRKKLIYSLGEVGVSELETSAIVELYKFILPIIVYKNYTIEQIINKPGLIPSEEKEWNSIMNVIVEALFNQSQSPLKTIINQLNKIKCSLINLRNNKYEIEKEIEEIDLSSKNKSKEIENLHCACPVCNQEINSIEEKLKENYKIEEYLVLKNEYSVSIHEIDRKISLEQIKYQGFLDKLKFYEDKVSSGDSKISNVLNHLAYGETRDRLLKDFQINEEKIEKLNISYKENSKKLRSYNDLKTKAHNLYSTYMFESKHSFNLAEISDDKIKKIGQNFEWRGSNRPITTLAGVGQRFGASS
nr:hypothetical protein [Candidatus Paceibacterota bacterium]